MNHFLEKVILDARTALARAPKLTEGYALLIDVARTVGAQRGCGEVAREGLSVAPASMRIRWALAMCRLPRWGGSHEAVRAIWDQAEPFVADHPALAALGGVVSWDLGRLSEAMRRFAIWRPRWRPDRTRRSFSIAREGIHRRQEGRRRAGGCDVRTGVGTRGFGTPGDSVSVARRAWAVHRSPGDARPPGGSRCHPRGRAAVARVHAETKGRGCGRQHRWALLARSPASQGR